MRRIALKIKNQELKFKIYNILKKNENEDLEEEDLKKVKRISVNKENMDSEDILFEEKDFEVLKYVETLTLNMFDINDELVKQIANMKNLNFLIFNHCKVSTQLSMDNPLKNVVITYSKNLNLNIFSEKLSLKMLKLIEVENINIYDLKKYKNLEYIYLFNSKIENFELLEEFEKLKEVGLDGSNISEKVCDNLKSRNIKVHYQDEYLPV